MKNLHSVPQYAASLEPDERDEVEASDEPGSSAQGREDDLLKARLAKTCGTRPTKRLFQELRKEGFRMGGDRGFHIYSRSGKEFVLNRPTQWDAAVHFERMWSFVKAERWPGQFCERCREWVPQAELDEAEELGSVGYAAGCLGTCATARQRTK